MIFTVCGQVLLLDVSVLLPVLCLREQWKTESLLLEGMNFFVVILSFNIEPCS